jgi:vitamin B12 transporter
LGRFSFGNDKRDYDTIEDYWFKVISKQAQAQITYRNDLLSLTSGVDYLNYSGSSSEGAFDQSHTSYTDIALFSIGKLHLFDDRFILSAGGRFDKFSLEQGDINATSHINHFSPSIGLAYLPAEWIKLRANYAHAFALPTTMQLGINNKSYWGPMEYITIGNPDLKPEKSNTYEFGIDLMNEYANINGTYFFSKTKDYIDSYTVSTTATQSISSYRNLFKAYRSGVELNFNVDLAGLANQNFEFRPSVTMTHFFKYTGKILSTSDYDVIPSIPETLYTLGLYFYQKDVDLTVNFSLTSVGEQNRDNTRKIEAYSIADLFVKKRLLSFEDKGKLSAKLAIQNLADEYVSVTDFGDYPFPGRSFYLGLIYEY